MPRQTDSNGDADPEPFRATLLDRKNEFLSSLGLETSRFVVTGRVSDEDQVQAVHDEYIALCLTSVDYEQLCLVEEVLARLDAGAFGRCLECGQSIPLLRLQALPWARYCVVCQRRTTDMGQQPPPTRGRSPANSD